MLNYSVYFLTVEAFNLKLKMSFFINHQLPFVMNHSASLERREYFRVYQTRAISVFRVKFNVEFTRLAVNFS